MPEPPVRLHVSRSVAAPPERVFDAWVDPEAIERWMATAGDAGAPGRLSRVRVDARAGGTFSFVDVRDGEEIDHTGEYLEVDPPRRLAFTWGIPQYSADSDRITIDFEPDDEGTLVHLVCELDPAWREYSERTRRAWQLMLDSIARVVERRNDGSE